MINDKKFVFNQPFFEGSLNTFKKLFNLEDHFDQETKDILKDYLIRDIFTLYKELMDLNAN